MTQQEAQKVAEAFNEIIDYARFKLQKVLGEMIQQPKEPEKVKETD